MLGLKWNDLWLSTIINNKFVNTFHPTEETLIFLRDRKGLEEKTLSALSKVSCYYNHKQK